MRPIPELAVNIIKTFEQCHLTPYKDPGGLWTVGWGHLVTKEDPPEWRKETVGVLTQKQADELLVADMDWAAACVDKAVTRPLAEYQRAALISLVYNIGCATFKGSRTLVALNDGRIESALSEWMGFAHQDGKYLRGLDRRRAIETFVFRGLANVRTPSAVRWVVGGGVLTPELLAELPAAVGKSVVTVLTPVPESEHGEG